jgi:hypothetical protein
MTCPNRGWVTDHRIRLRVRHRERCFDISHFFLNHLVGWERASYVIMFRQAFVTLSLRFHNICRSEQLRSRDRASHGSEYGGYVNWKINALGRIKVACRNPNIDHANAARCTAGLSERLRRARVTDLIVRSAGRPSRLGIQLGFRLTG